MERQHAIINSSHAGRSAVIASANQLTEVPSPPPAPIGHAQPRAEDFSPRSQPNQEEQDRLSTFDAQQQNAVFVTRE